MSPPPGQMVLVGLAAIGAFMLFAAAVGIRTLVVSVRTRCTRQ